LERLMEMSEVGDAKWLEAGLLLAAGVAFAWWQLRDVKRGQERSRAEAQARQQTSEKTPAQTPTQTPAQTPAQVQMSAQASPTEPSNREAS
jgi:predicted negative regulator of RcsB-dependent stress response